MSWFRPGTLAHFVRDTVREDLDLSRIMETYTEERGYPPYHPAMMVALLLMLLAAACTPRAKSRRVARNGSISLQ
jgi:transposase